MDEAGFLQALRENPEDDITLLVMADWFEERGDPAGATRGELLRVQAELGRWVPDLVRRTLLQQRERELLEQHAPDFLGPLRQRCPAWRLEGGLLHATVEAHRFASHRFAAQVEGWLRQGRLAVLRLRGSRNTSSGWRGRRLWPPSPPWSWTTTPWMTPLSDSYWVRPTWSGCANST